jgi:glycosyltransferase involved in cell wall biosynthesis
MAQALGIRIISTDGGGRWQHTAESENMSGTSDWSRWKFEEKILACSDVVVSYTRYPELLYGGHLQHRRVRAIMQPGMLGIYPEPRAKEEAQRHLGLSEQCGYVYACLTEMHSEQELLYLIDAFHEIQLLQIKEAKKVQLLLIGMPDNPRKQEKQEHWTKLLQQAALNPDVHILPGISRTGEHREVIAYVLGAADAVVLPHLDHRKAGVLETALLAISYERLAIVPNLPRFKGMLHGQTCTVYEAGNRASLVKALQEAKSKRFRLTEKGKEVLDAQNGWRKLVQQIIEIYKQSIS